MSDPTGGSVGRVVPMHADRGAPASTSTSDSGPSSRRNVFLATIAAAELLGIAHLLRTSGLQWRRSLLTSVAAPESDLLRAAIAFAFGLLLFVVSNRDAIREALSLQASERWPL